MKKLLALLLALTLVISLAACAGNEESPADEEAGDDVITETEDGAVPEDEDDAATAPEEDPTLDQPAEPGEETDGAVDMPTLDAGDADGQMPAVTPEDGAVEMPDANPDAEPDVPVVAPVTPEQPKEETVVPAPETPAPEAPETSGTNLLSMVLGLYSGITEMDEVMFGEMELTADDFEFHSFIPYIDGARAVVRMPMMGSIAHKVVLIETPAGVDAGQVAADMKANADPRWLICVTAESVQTASKGNLAVLVMGTQSVADAIIANFNAL